MAEEKLMDEEKLKEIAPEERAAAWEKYVRDEVNRVLDIYLPESITGNIGIKYLHPAKGFDDKAGKPILDDKKAKGVTIVVDFEFADSIEFFDKIPKGAKPKPKK